MSAPPEWVFRPLTDAEQLARWWDGDGTIWTIDAGLHGVWTSSGQDESCRPWSMDGVMLEWDPAEGGTRLRVTHTGFDGYPEALTS